MNCSLFETYFATTNRVLLAQGLAAKCLRLTNLRVEIHTTKTAIRPWPIEEGSGMNPLLLTSVPPADLEKGREQGP